MSYTFRVYPQPGSVGYRRNRAMKRQIQQQAHFNRLQNLQLQRQLNAFVPGGNMYGRNYVGQYASPYGNYFPTQTAYNQGIGYGYGFNTPFQVSPYQYGGYTTLPAYTGATGLFGSLFNSLTNWL